VGVSVQKNDSFGRISILGMGAVCTNGSKHVLEASAKEKFTIVDTNESCRRIYEAMSDKNNNLPSDANSKSPHKSNERHARIPRKWEAERDCKGGWYDRIIRGRKNIQTGEEFDHMRTLAKAVFDQAAIECSDPKQLSKEEWRNMEFKHFQVFLRELLWAVFSKHKVKAAGGHQDTNNITLFNVAKVIGILAFGSSFVQYLEHNEFVVSKEEEVKRENNINDRYAGGKSNSLEEKPVDINKKKEMKSLHDFMTKISGHLLKTSNELFCEEAKEDANLATKTMHFDAFLVLITRFLARNLDRGTGRSGSYYLDIGNLVDDVIADAETRQKTQIVTYAVALGNRLRQYKDSNGILRNRDNFSLKETSLETILQMIREIPKKSWSKETNVPDGLRRKIVEELEWQLEGRVPPARSKRTLTSHGMNLTNVAKRIIQEIKPMPLPKYSKPTDNRRTGKRVAEELLQAIALDWKPIVPTMRMSRLHQRLSSDEKHLNWVGIDLIDHLKGGGNTGTILVSPLSASAMLLMAQVATRSTTRYEIEEFVGDIASHDLEEYDIFDNIFGPGDSKVKSAISFSQSLWVPDRFSKAYGNAVNTYVSGHVGSFKQGDYFPPIESQRQGPLAAAHSGSMRKSRNESVDAWARTATNGKVFRVFGSTLYNVSSMLVGVVCFKVPWRNAFIAPGVEKPRISQYPVDWFQVDSSHRMKCRYMQSAPGIEFPYITSKDAFIVNVPFASGGLEALIAVPRYRKRREQLASAQRRDEDDMTGGKSYSRDLWSHLFDPPSFEHILHPNKSAPPKTLATLLEKMKTNKKRGKAITKLTLPMGRIEWTGNLKNSIRSKFEISEIFSEEDAELTEAIGSSNDYCYLSGIIQRTSLELIPDGAEGPAMDSMTASSEEIETKNSKHLKISRPFLIVIHANAQAVLMGHIHTIKSPEVDGRVEQGQQEGLLDPWKDIKRQIHGGSGYSDMEMTDDDDDDDDW